MTGSRTARLAVAFTLLLTLAACSPAVTPDDPPAASNTPTAEPTPLASASPPGPLPTQEPRTASCEGLLDLEKLEEILTSGYDVLPAEGYIAKIRAEGSPYALFDDYGGIVCPVNNGSRVSELYAYSPISFEDQSAQETRLTAEGWKSSSHDGGTLYTTPPTEGIVFAFYFRDGQWWCGYDTGVIDMIVANTP